MPGMRTIGNLDRRKDPILKPLTVVSRLLSGSIQHGAQQPKHFSKGKAPPTTNKRQVVKMRL
jgi:hypothetical protein